MTIFQDENSIKKFLQPKIEIIVNEILAGIEEWNKKEIERNVYNKGTPSYYERTEPEFNFESAWGGKIKESNLNFVEGEFEYKPDNMSLGYEIDGQHSAVYPSKKYGTDAGFDIRPYLAEIIYEGLAGDVFGHGFWTEKRDAWSALLKIAKVDGPKMKTWINKGARKAGLKIEW